jgi:hypothetical protein
MLAIPKHLGEHLTSAGHCKEGQDEFDIFSHFFPTRQMTNLIEFDNETSLGSLNVHTYVLLQVPKSTDQNDTFQTRVFSRNRIIQCVYIDRHSEIMHVDKLYETRIVSEY